MPYILGTRIDPISYDEASAQIVGWGRRREKRAVAAANVHMLITAHDDPHFRELLNRFDCITPDGMPLVWHLRTRGFDGQRRVYGPDLMVHVCAGAQAAGVPVGIFGGSEAAVRQTVETLKQRFPALIVGYAFSPRVRMIDQLEDVATIRSISQSGVGILFVALGCPKQERWIARHRDLLPMVLIGVGAAVDFLSGQVSQAPRWLQRIGLEWLFRLAVDPRRLASRYLYTNSKYIYLLMTGRV